MTCALDDGVGRQPRISTRVEETCKCPGQDPTITGNTVLDAPALCTARRADLHFLCAIPHELDRPPCQNRAQDRQRFDNTVDLATKTATNRSADKMQARGRHIQKLGGRTQRKEQRLCRGVTDEAVVCFRGSDRAAGLDRRLLDRGHLVLAFNNVVGFGEAFLDVPEAQLLVVVKVVIVEGVVGIDLVDNRRVRLQRRFRVENVRQHLVVHSDGSTGVSCLPLGFGNDRGHGLADIGNLCILDQFLLILAEIDKREQRVEVVRHVARQHDAHDTGHAFRLAGIDGPDAGMVMRRAHAAHVKQTVEQVVVVVRRASGHVPQDVLATRRFADFLQVVVTLIREEIFSEFNR